MCISLVFTLIHCLRVVISNKITRVEAILTLKMAAKKNKQLLIHWFNWNAWYRECVHRYQLNSYALPTRQYKSIKYAKNGSHFKIQNGGKTKTETIDTVHEIPGNANMSIPIVFTLIHCLRVVICNENDESGGHFEIKNGCQEKQANIHTVE